VPDGDMPGQLTEGRLGKDVGNPAHAGKNPDFLTVSRGDTRAFLAAVLEGK